MTHFEHRPPAPTVDESSGRPQLARRRFLSRSVAGVAAVAGLQNWTHTCLAAADGLGDDLVASIEKTTLWRGRDGGTTWFHPRACMVPGTDGPTALMTLQDIGGSDYFGPVHWATSSDLGVTWTEPKALPALGRRTLDDGTAAGVCDVVPEYHPPTQTVLALGHNVFYRNGRFFREQPPRAPMYAVRNAQGQWSQAQMLEWDDPRGSEIYTNNCGQRVVLPDGDILLAMSFGQDKQPRSVAGVRCGFDGHTLSIKEVGPALEHSAGRGLLEPSLTQFEGRYYLTIRAEDNRGYLSVSDDGLQWEDKSPWKWDDGELLTMSTTQQHWLTHSDGLYLVYTRKDASNANVIRWRSPLFLAKVDVERRCLVRATERVVLPLVGDGVNDPNKVALMGNFHITNVTADESWVTVGEWMPRNGYRGDTLLARIRWNKPNRRV